MSRTQAAIIARVLLRSGLTRGFEPYFVRGDHFALHLWAQDQPASLA